MRLGVRKLIVLILIDCIFLLANVWFVVVEADVKAAIVDMELILVDLVTPNVDQSSFLV